MHAPYERNSEPDSAPSARRTLWSHTTPESRRSHDKLTGRRVCPSVHRRNPAWFPNFWVISEIACSVALTRRSDTSLNGTASITFCMAASLTYLAQLSLGDDDKLDPALALASKTRIKVEVFSICPF